MMLVRKIVIGRLFVIYDISVGMVDLENLDCVLLFYDFF